MGHINLDLLMEQLGREKIDSILLEGGGTLNWAALEAGVVQKIQAYIAPKLFGGITAKTPVEGRGVEEPDQAFFLRHKKISVLGEDLLVEGEIERNVYRIIEEKGIISKIMKTDSQAVLTIKASKIMNDIHKGDSIAVNGICLTVTAFSKNEFQADVMHETLNRTSLKMLKPGSSVNLERAMAADGRFGGHIVSGHIDGTGKITEIKEDSLAIWYTIEHRRKYFAILWKGVSCY